MLVAFEVKDERATSATQGSFSFAAGGGRTAFQNFLTGNAGLLCGSSCTYTEPKVETVSRLRFHRYEFFVQDSWRARPKLTFDFGMRYAVFPASPIATTSSRTSSPPASTRRPLPPGRARTRPPSSREAATSRTGSCRRPERHRTAAASCQRTRTTSSPAWASRGTPAKALTDDRPRRLGASTTTSRCGIFLQNAVVNPPFVDEPDGAQPAALEPRRRHQSTHGRPAGARARSRRAIRSSARGRSSGTSACSGNSLAGRDRHRLRGIGWRQPHPTGGPQRRPAGRRGRVGDVNGARPYPGYAGITMRQTTAKAPLPRAGRSGSAHDAGRAGLSQRRLHPEPDQDRRDQRSRRDRLAAGPDRPGCGVRARAHRPHPRLHGQLRVRAAVLPGLEGVRQGGAGGWQVSGITTFWSGPPISRVVNGTTNGSRRGIIRVDQVGDPFANLPADAPGDVYYFNPAAYAPPADGRHSATPAVPSSGCPASTSGTSALQELVPVEGHAPAAPGGLHQRLQPHPARPGRHPERVQRLVPGHLRAGGGDPFGQITSTRNPREIQLGLRLGWQ